MPVSEAQKKATKKWRDANREKYNEYTLIAVKKWADQHKEVIKEKKKEYYIANRETIKEKNKARYHLKKQLKADKIVTTIETENNEEVAIINENN
jgi:hypothetical protein